ncbi:ScbA/BarX family gamma-butyrolactone biosynthesis protein, partial [Streptomyces sp. NPDC058086]|uniref:ScbA/BarX family gamma-butyrolactone biosynthesis protein n=1 Tax=Streptomyces sp. NPDC058086 TaxID=3346334 RepID=UPI0036E0C85F
MTLLTVHQDNQPTPATTSPDTHPSTGAGTDTATEAGAGTGTAAGTTPLDPTRMPRLTTTVPREYVHRSTLAEVFLTGCEQTSDTHYTLTAQWPRAHTFFTTPDGTHHHPLQAAETIRQTGLYLAHAELGIPLGHHFLMRNLHLTTHPQHLTIGPTPTDLTLTATYTPHHPHTKRPTDFTMHITITRNGHPTATGTGRFTCLTPTTYQRLRHPHTTTHTNTTSAGPGTHQHPNPQPTPAPTHYGRTLPHDIVLTPTPHPHTWQLTPN